MGENVKLTPLKTLGGCFMPKRFVAFVRGDPDAIPGDYLLAIVAVVGMILATVAQISLWLYLKSNHAESPPFMDDIPISYT